MKDEHPNAPVWSTASLTFINPVQVTKLDKPGMEDLRGNAMSDCTMAMTTTSLSLTKANAGLLKQLKKKLYDFSRTVKDLNFVFHISKIIAQNTNFIIRNCRKSLTHKNVLPILE